MPTTHHKPIITPDRTHAVFGQLRLTLQIGGMTKSSLLQYLNRAGVQINPIGQQLFADERFRTLEMPLMVETCLMSVAELGLSHGGTFAQILEAAGVNDLKICPLELGPHLRLALQDQAEGVTGEPQTPHQAPSGSITVASAPLDECDDTPKGFYLRRIEGALWLRGYKSWPGHVWRPEDVFAFACET